ncbi:MAG TPA: glycosyltransferase family 4 protein [Solirubrobacterales bacterium]|nr:glycosyltransferase family 4 protein [Solirubrobacterales bacterium]
MRVLLFHGYMLRGTGSNIYSANLARALAGLGHEVHLLCQDREVELPGVRIHNPDIHGLLPVYVKDPYPGFEVKAFPELSDEELDRYIEANVAAVREVIESAGPPDAALAGHLVMGPCVLARAGVESFAAKIHGSALEYTVKPHPRFLPFAEEGMRAASCVLVGSRHTAESLWNALPGVGGLREKTRLGPPGVDTERFRPSQERDPARVVFVGKFIVSKGLDLLLAAWPLVRRRHPDARLQVAGYGEYEGGLKQLLAALDRGDLDAAGEVARRGWALEGGEEKPLRILSAFLADPPAGYSEAARGMAGSVELLGRLEHDEVADLLPGAQALVMPSTFPEAFGMVAAEAAACGVLPVSAGHSGMREVSKELAATLPEGLGRLTSFPVDENAVQSIAERLDAWLALPDEERELAREALVATTARLWSWEGVARGVIAASRGELDRLPLA